MKYHIVCDSTEMPKPSTDGHTISLGTEYVVGRINRAGDVLEMWSLEPDNERCHEGIDLTQEVDVAPTITPPPQPNKAVNTLYLGLLVCAFFLFKKAKKAFS